MPNVSDLSLKFFNKVYFDRYNRNTASTTSNEAPDVEVDVPIQVNIEYHNPDNTSEIVGTKTYEETIKMLQSKIDNNDFVVNYQSSVNNSTQPIQPRVETYSSASISSVLDWSNKYPQLTLLPRHIVLLKDFQSYPANRFMVLRRFDDGVAHDLFRVKGKKPISTMVGYYDLLDSPISIKFGEKWEKMHDTMYDVIQDIIGIKFSTMPGIGKFMSFGESNPFAQDFMYKVGTALGFIGTEDPYGEANLIYESSTRVVDGENLGVGLTTDFNFTFETVYEYREIPGLDGQRLLKSLIFEAQKMGTSNGKFLASDKGLNTAASLFKSLESGKISNVLTAIKDAVLEVANTALTGLTDMLTASDDDGDETATTTTTSDIGSTAANFITKVDKAIGSFAKSRYNRYKWKIHGILGAMSGKHTAPWHLTLGNPMAPWFSMGNLVLNDISIEPTGELMYDDYPSEWKITATLGNGRAMGGNEIFACFNPGAAREYTNKDRLSKIINVKIPEGSSIVFGQLNDLTIDPDSENRNNDNAKSEEINKNDIENDPDSIDPANGAISDFSAE